MHETGNGQRLVARIDVLLGCITAEQYRLAHATLSVQYRGQVSERVEGDQMISQLPAAFNSLAQRFDGQRPVMG
jgi:hypothetical protein